LLFYLTHVWRKDLRIQDPGTERPLLWPVARMTSVNSSGSEPWMALPWPDEKGTGSARFCIFAPVNPYYLRCLSLLHQASLPVRYPHMGTKVPPPGSPRMARG